MREQDRLGETQTEKAKKRIRKENKLRKRERMRKKRENGEGWGEERTRKSARENARAGGWLGKGEKGPHRGPPCLVTQQPSGRCRGASWDSRLGARPGAGGHGARSRAGPLTCCCCGLLASLAPRAGPSGLPALVPAASRGAGGCDLAPGSGLCGCGRSGAQRLCPHVRPARRAASSEEAAGARGVLRQRGALTLRCRPPLGPRPRR